MRHWSLTGTLVAAFVCLGALPAAVLGWRLIATTNAMSGALTHATSREGEQSLQQSLQTAARSLTDRLDTMVLERYEDAQACGVNTALLYRRAWYRVGNTRNRIVRAANRYVKIFGVYSLAMMVDLNGVKQASGQQTQGIDLVTHALKQMGQATQSAAATAEESAATGQELTAVARSALAIIANLERVISGFSPALPSAHTQAPGGATKRSFTSTSAAARTQPKPPHSVSVGATVGASAGGNVGDTRPGARRGTARAA